MDRQQQATVGRLNVWNRHAGPHTMHCAHYDHGPLIARWEPHRPWPSWHCMHCDREQPVGQDQIEQALGAEQLPNDALSELSAPPAIEVPLGTPGDLRDGTVRLPFPLQALGGPVASFPEVMWVLVGFIAGLLVDVALRFLFSLGGGQVSFPVLLVAPLACAVIASLLVRRRYPAMPVQRYRLVQSVSLKPGEWVEVSMGKGSRVVRSSGLPPEHRLPGGVKVVLCNGESRETLADYCWSVIDPQ